MEKLGLDWGEKSSNDSNQMNPQKTRMQSVQRYVQQQNAQRIQQAAFLRRRIAYMVSKSDFSILRKPMMNSTTIPSLYSLNTNRVSRNVIPFTDIHNQIW